VSNFNYVGIDETSLAIGSGLIIVGAYSDNDALTRNCNLEKAGDLLKKVVANRRLEDQLTSLFPSLVEMYSTGLDGFTWMRANKGRFNRQEIQHAAIAHMIASNNFKPQRTVLLIDNYYGNGFKTEELIFEYLNRLDFKIPRKNIECHAGGDRSIPLINYADLIAFQITVDIKRRYAQYFPNAINFPISIQEIPYDENRVHQLTEEHRVKLEEVLVLVRN
jgi:hypothetical protein